MTYPSCAVLKSVMTIVKKRHVEGRLNGQDHVACMTRITNAMLNFTPKTDKTLYVWG